MPTRTARTAWTGTLQTGSGRVELVSSGVGSYDASGPRLQRAGPGRACGQTCRWVRTRRVGFG